MRAAGRERGNDVPTLRTLEHRHAGHARRFGELVDGGFAETALRHAHRAAEGLVVGGIRDELEIRHQVANLAAVVEADGADEPVWHGLTTQRFLERAALRIGAIEHGDVAVSRGRLTGPAHADLTHDEVGFVALVERSHERDRLSGTAGRAQRLAHSRRVRADDDVRQIEDLRRGAVVLLEAHDRCVGEILVEVQDVPDVGAAPPIDGLVVVTHDAHVAVLAAEQLDQLVLGAVGVLVLVDEEILELVAVPCEAFGVALEHAHRQHEQVVEVDRVGEAQRLLEAFEDRRHRLGKRIQRHALVLRRLDERVLGIGDRRVDGARRELLGRDSVPLHQALHDAERIVLVVDRVRRCTVHEMRRRAEHAGPDRVERAGPHAGGRAAEEPADAVAHFAGGFVGERDREDVSRGHAFDVDEARDARREDPRLARPRARQDEERTVHMEYSLALRRVEARRQPLVQHRLHQ